MPEPGRAALDRTTAAAAAFLERLDTAHAHVAHLDFGDDDPARHDWHYIPRKRAGLALVDMTAPEAKAAYDLLATGLALPAFAAASTIVALEDVLDEIESKAGPRRFSSERRPWGRHRADYSVTVFGAVGDAAPWGWRFEGHHVSINVTVVDGEVAATPQFLGSNPAEVVTAGGRVVTRPLAAEEDLAVELVAALPPDRREDARLSTEAPDDILSTNAASLADAVDGGGVRLADLGGAARASAEALVRHYVWRLPDDLAAARWSSIEAGIGDVRFAFAGDVAHRRAHYYRLEGPALFVEYDNTQAGANHVHSVLRDRGGDFGHDLLRRHRRLHH
jgi:hypothetical protein